MAAELLADYLSRWAGADAGRRDVAATVEALADACRGISALVAQGNLEQDLGAAVTENVQGETQKALDELTDRLLIEACRRAPVAAVASEEDEHPVPVDPDGRLLVAFDPLDGSSNIDINVSIGTIFSVLPRLDGVDPASDESFLQPGRAQLAGGYVLYGPQTTLVMTVGAGSVCFTLDRKRDAFAMTHARLDIPRATKEFAINMANQRHWPEPVKRYIDECLQGAEGARGENTNMRWVASLVADCNRVLMRGGVFLYPGDARPGYGEGRIRVLYEASPIAFVVEQAGGHAVTGFGGRVMDIEPRKLHQRASLIFGSRDEIARIEGHHAAA
ncbi:class 1 fructose-bisphosphatase [Lichenibacterium dinghuense]|uniref:class 1 fructose-bisphosphatase n=1 Tax=Lichenibacterium dinghuense TaxID=2895977 RepID=UPI001EFF79E8|nr:class 1 fructose-bisphosphatase [Lichenibacterium sp. 6Y81]